ncbi:MAG: hypothetical protein IIZ49_03980 [Oscillospiraceae bacterium]|nr:hypothetical protein [Oscillospiraceae bacterium]
MKKTLIVLFALALALLSACGRETGENTPMENTEMPGYTQISQEEALRIMEEESGFLIVDVRRHDEYDAGHIPGAVCVPNETISEEAEDKLPDKDQMLLVYCRTGRRSKEAAEKLAALGYTNVLEFGGIVTWPGEVVTDEAGNQPEEKIPEEPVKPEETKEEEEEKKVKLLLEIGDTTLSAVFAENSTVDALKALLSEPLTLEMDDYAGMEKGAPLPEKLPENNEPMDPDFGDIILYQGRQFVIYYGPNSWSLTPIAKIEDITRDELCALLGEGSVTVTLRLSE